MVTVDPLNPPKTIHAVICYIERESDGKYLLLHKAKEKFGGGLWNAPGGKIETAESAEAATVREVYEETNLKVSNLEKVGELIFFFGEKKEKPDWTAIVSHESIFGIIFGGLFFLVNLGTELVFSTKVGDLAKMKQAYSGSSHAH